jgi:tRNA G18 (ribose-2'-O)-methylase SpoU
MIDLEQTIALIQNLKKDGYTLCAIEQHKKSKNLFKYQPPLHDKIALIVGNEVNGVPASILDCADIILEIPMRGKKESLNVSVAFGIAAYHLQNTKLQASNLK